MVVGMATIASLSTAVGTSTVAAARPLTASSRIRRGCCPTCANILPPYEHPFPNHNGKTWGQPPAHGTIP